ncbi:MAG TPA: hypothetical protein PLB14_03175 [Smithellaceae bacterium]|jgi:hypothetical protein|nr:hypothetical protein [Syntrophaceae bacterium]HPV48682.1 hypothetical protein [Smithellaceae bacterium]
MPPIFYRYDPFRESENKKRAGQVRNALWFAGNGKVEAIVRRETGVLLPVGETTPALLRVLAHNIMENRIGFGSSWHLNRLGLREPLVAVVRVPSHAFWSGDWIRETLRLPFTGQEMGRRLREASHSLERGVSYAWGQTDEKDNDFRLYGDGDVFLASERLAEGLAFVYRGVLEASVRHLETKGEAGVDELEQGLRQSSLGDDFAQTVSKNREALLENPILKRNYSTGTTAVKPAVAAPLKSPQEFVPECSITAFSLQCGHGDRGYVLDVLGGRPTDGARYLLQVVSEQNKFDEMTVNFAGNCGFGKRGCPAIKVNGGEETWKSPHQFKVKYKTTEMTDRFGLFIKRFLVPDLDALVPEEYIISARGCSAGSARRATIHSFPPFKSWGKINFGYNPDKAKTKSGNAERFLDAWFLEGELGYYVGDSTWKFNKGRIEDYFPKLGAAAGSVARGIDALTSEAEEENKKYGKIVKVQLQSKVALGANVELLESKGDYDVDFGGKIEFKLDPLIGADVHVDILQLLIKRAPGISSFLTMVRERAAQGIGNNKVAAQAVVELNLIISGKAGASLAWQKKAKDKWLSIEGEKTANRSVSLTVSLIGKIKAKAKIFYVKITVGAGFELKGARSQTEGIGGVMDLFATTAEGKPAVGGEFIFTGATIYYLYYAEVSVEENKNGSKSNGGWGGSGKKGKGTSTKNKVFTRREEKSGKYELFKPRTWPEWSSEKDKQKGAGFEKLDI